MGLLDNVYAATPQKRKKAIDAQWVGDTLMSDGKMVMQAPSLGDAAQAINSFMPITGDIQSGLLAANDFKQGNYKSAALNAIGLLPFIPSIAAHTVWHGSPHTFDKLDISKVGKGSGHQNYGHGLYFSENPEVAKSYSEIPATWSEPFKQGNIYKVDIPDEAIPKMLDWDKPLSEQNEFVKKAIKDIKNNLSLSSDGWDAKPWIDSDPLASTFYNQMIRNNFLTSAEMSNKLKDYGVTGTKYADGANKKNFVVFDDKLPKILERNGKGLLAK
jgi:hypothetical protein